MKTKEEVNHGFGDASPIKVWYAADKNGERHFYLEKPKRFYTDQHYAMWRNNDGSTMHIVPLTIYIEDIPPIEWEDEPIEVEITFKIV